MTKEEAILVLDNARPQTKEIDRQFYDDEDLNNALDIAIKALEQQPNDETIKYLECNDIDVQEFIKAMKRQPLQAVNPNSMLLIFEQMNRPNSEDCVSRADLIDKLEILDKRYGSDLYWEVRKIVDILPPVTPTHETCKDCFYYNIDEDGHGYHCEKYEHTRFPVYANFYCADFEKRGGENG